MPPGQSAYRPFKLLTVKQVARQIGYNVDTVYKLKGVGIVFGMGHARWKG